MELNLKRCRNLYWSIESKNMYIDDVFVRNIRMDLLISISNFGMMLMYKQKRNNELELSIGMTLIGD